jgi:hypothetical protein
VGVSFERDADIGMPHEVLERLRIHARLGLIAAVGMAADVWRDVGPLDPVLVLYIAMNGRPVASFRNRKNLRLLNP